MRDIRAEIDQNKPKITASPHTKMPRKNNPYVQVKALFLYLDW